MDLTFLTPYLPFIYALLAGVTWAIYGWLTSTNNNDFSKIRFISTVCTALLVVTIMWQAGVPLDQATFEQQMVVYAVFTVGLERLFTKIADWINKRQTPVQFLQSAVDPAIKFSAAPTTGAAPLPVVFTDLVGWVKYWNFGDGKFGTWDTAGQTVITHTYPTAGTYEVRGMGATAMSEPVTITVTGAPVPPPAQKKTWLEVLIAWIKRVLGIA